MKSIKTTFVRGLSLLLALVIMLNLPISAFAADEDGIEAYAYTYDDARAEMMAHPAFSALKYLGYDRDEYLEDNGKLYDYVGSNLLDNYPDCLTDVPYGSSGLGSGLQTSSSNTGYLNVSSITGKYPDVSYFETGGSKGSSYKGLDCVDYAAYYLTNYLPNIEGIEYPVIADAVEYFSAKGTKYTYDNLYFWDAARDYFIDNGVDVYEVTKVDGYYGTISSWKDPDGNVHTSDIYEDLPIGCLIQMGESGDLDGDGTVETCVHYAIYAGTYNGKHYIYHSGSTKRGPEISRVESMAGQYNTTKVSVALYFYDFSPSIIEENYGAVEVYKADPDGKPLANAVFSLVNNDTGEDYTLITGNDGTAMVEDLLIDCEYTLTEEDAPPGYNIAEEHQWTFTLTAEKPTYSVTVTNTPITGSLTVYKDDPDGKPLAGAKFLIVNTETGASWTITTDSTGYASQDELPLGSYTVKEIEAPEGYKLDDTVYKVTLSEENLTGGEPIHVTNTPKTGSLKFIKDILPSSAATAGNLAGWQFQIFSNSPSYTTTIRDGVQYRVKVTNKNGDFIYSEPALMSNQAASTGSINIQSITPSKGAIVDIGEEQRFTVRVSGTGYTYQWQIQTTPDGNWKDLKGETSSTLSLTMTEDCSNSKVRVRITKLFGDTLYSDPITFATPDSFCIVSGPQDVTGTDGTEVTLSVTANGEDLLYQWEMYDEATGNWVSVDKQFGGTYTTGNDGTVQVNEIPVGDYYVVEIDTGREGWLYDLTPKTVTISEDNTAELPYEVTFTNELLQGGMLIQKETEDGKNLDGWLFGIYTDEACTQKVVEYVYTTNGGQLLYDDLTPGTYWVKELRHESQSITDLYYCANNPQKVVIETGETSMVRFENRLRTGTGKVVKTTTNGGSAAGWQFHFWTDTADLGVYTTDGNGEIVLDNLLPGTVYVQEVGHETYDLRYWIMDTEVKELTIETGKTSSVSFENVWMGELVIDKQTINSDLLAGWTGDLYLVNADNSETSGIEPLTKIGTYTSDEYGRFAELLVAPGKYIFRETGHSDSSVDLTYWIMAGDKEIVVNAGATTPATIINTELGYGQIIKDTTNGGTKEGWLFEVKDAAGNPLTGSPFTTYADGKIDLGLLPPGEYTVQEIGHANMTPEQLAYWAMDTEVKTLVIEAGSTASVRFENQWQGMGRIKKEMPDGGSVAGWTFDVYRVSDNAYIGEFTSEENGDIALGYLIPGDYRVIERIPEGSLYLPVGGNEKILTVVAGEVKSVTFRNVLRSGEIIVNKADGNNGAALAGAKFLLEWLDNDIWKPVVLSDTIIPGGCRSEGLENGCLVTGEDGRIVFEGLHPDLEYRLTEIEAPNGYALQSAPVFEGKLPVNALSAEVDVLNYGVIELPPTGVEAHLTGLTVFTVIVVCLFFAMVALAIKEGMLTEFIHKHRK